MNAELIVGDPGVAEKVSVDLQYRKERFQLNGREESFGGRAGVRLREAGTARRVHIVVGARCNTMILTLGGGGSVLRIENTLVPRVHVKVYTCAMEFWGYCPKDSTADHLRRRNREVCDQDPDTVIGGITGWGGVSCHFGPCSNPVFSRWRVCAQVRRRGQGTQ